MNGDISTRFATGIHLTQGVPGEIGNLGEIGRTGNPSILHGLCEDCISYLEDNGFIQVEGGHYIVSRTDGWDALYLADHAYDQN